MAFDLLDNNLDGPAVIAAPGGVNATAANFIDDYTYAQKYAPHLIPQLHSKYGKGKILKLSELMGNEDVYASDTIYHSEENRLHNLVKDVSESSGTFTSPEPHNARVKDTILITDGAVEVQATVTNIGSDVVFTATPDDGSSFDFDGNVDVLVDFTNSWSKGSGNFDVSREWEPDIIQNYSHILKEFYTVNGSDMVHNTWIETPDGPRWYNYEMMRTMTLFENKVEFTHMFHKRKTSGNDKGMNGVIPTVEERGNISNEYITTIDDLSEIARRIKQQGGASNSYNVWHDHKQGRLIREMLSGVNSHYSSGSNYGAFNNSRDMSIALGFNSVFIDGISFFFQPWEITDDPSLMGSAKFRQTGVAFLMIPNGNVPVYENGETKSLPYLTVMYRGDAAYNRKRELKLFGPNGTAQKADKQEALMLCETTNKICGANNYFVGRASDVY